MSQRVANWFPSHEFAILIFGSRKNFHRTAAFRHRPEGQGPASSPIRRAGRACVLGFPLLTQSGVSKVLQISNFALHLPYQPGLVGKARVQR
jgi:hypothetical protein